MTHVGRNNSESVHPHSYSYSYSYSHFHHHSVLKQDQYVLYTVTHSEMRRTSLYVDESSRVIANMRVYLVYLEIHTPPQTLGSMAMIHNRYRIANQNADAAQ